METESVFSTIFSLALLTAILRGATPLVFAAMGGLFSERSGLVQIGLEGMMLIGALVGSIVAYQTGSPWLGFAGAAIAGALASSLYGVFAIFLKTDQIVVGTGLNLLAVGIAPFITKIVYDSTGSTPGLPAEQRFTYEPFIFVFIAALLTWYIYTKTKAGLLLRFAGEEPNAVESAGYSVVSVRWFSIWMTGLMAGMGGGTLSLFLASSYSPNMTAGRGFMALAALIFGKWKPLPVLAACLFFALIDAIQIRLQGVPTGIPVQWIQILPYLVTIIALAGFFGHSRAPKALGQKLE